MSRAWLIIVIILWPLYAANASADTRKFALVVGNDEGHDLARKLRYAEQDAKKFFGVLTDLGGFKKADTTLLLGADAATIWSAALAMERRIAVQAKDAANKTLFIFYYSGHAEGDELEMGLSSLKLAALLKHLRASSADVRLAFLDSCRSGKLVTMKGGRRGPGFDIMVTDQIASKGYAIMTSSSDSELSQESSEIRGAFFTHYLVSALRGAGDRSNDGKVTLAEAYDYAYTRTLARTSVTVGGGQHPMYEFQLEGRGDVVLTHTAQTGSRLSVELPEAGRLIVMDETRQMIVAETELKRDQTAQVSLPPGRFHVYLITSEGAVRSADVGLLSGESVRLDAGHFQSVSLDQAVAKGGLFPPEKEITHSLSMGGVWRLWALEGAAASYGAALFYRARSTFGWQPTARLTWTTRGDVGVSRGYNDVGLLAGMGYALEIFNILLRAELLVGCEYLLQKRYEGHKRYTPGFDYLGLVGVGLPASQFVITLDLGFGGRTFQVIDKGWVHRFDFQAVLGLGWTWKR